METTYLCIDLKSFYASVECVERGLDPFKINLVVADPDRGRGAITLAATPAIKKLGVKSRGRIFEIPSDIEYITAPPRMALYMQYSAAVYRCYLKYIAPEDIHVYSVDEAFLNVTPYQALYHMNAKAIGEMIIKDIYQNTGLYATMGVGSNLFLAKVAMDILAKHNQSMIACLDEALFKQLIWHHRPITDIWMIGPQIAKRLTKYQIYDLYGITKIPSEILFKEFGKNAQALIDHAYGREFTTIEDIKAYQPKGHSLSNSQILFRDYDFKEALLILKEMVDTNVCTLNVKHLLCSRIGLTVRYSKNIIKASSSLIKLPQATNSLHDLNPAFQNLYHKIVNPVYPIRQIGISFADLESEAYAQCSLFVDEEERLKEKELTKTINAIRLKYGKNAILKGMNLEEAATQRYRNITIGGHKA